MARRPRPTHTVPPAEQLRQTVDAHLIDTPEATGREPARPLWSAMTPVGQAAVIEKATEGEAIPHWQAWTAGMPQDDEHRLIGAVHDVLLAQAADQLGWAGGTP